jgi:hypothetical protein
MKAESISPVVFPKPLPAYWDMGEGEMPIPVNMIAVAFVRDNRGDYNEHLLCVSRDNDFVPTWICRDDLISPDEAETQR